MTFKRCLGFSKRLLAQHASMLAHVCVAVQRFASKVDSLVKTFASQASTKARMQRGCGELEFAMVGQQTGDAHVDLDASLGGVLLEAFPLLSVRWLHISIHSFSPWQPGFSEMDA